MASSYRNGDVSWWHHEAGGAPAPQHQLGSDLDVDVCIVGGGFTGLWTAYYLARAQPELRIAVLEKEFCGFGASGRNGGFLGTRFTWPRQRYAARHGTAAVTALSDALFDTSAEVLQVLDREGIDADVSVRGSVMVAWTPPALARLRDSFRSERRWGVTDDQERFVGARELRDRFGMPTALGAIETPGAIRVNPARLVRGLRRAVLAAGVAVHEATPAMAIGPRRVRTPSGVVRAPVVLRCVEAFSARLPDARRRWLPMSSAMIATAPLPDSVWDTRLFRGTDLVDEYAHAFVYLQRSRSGRLLIGGRGVPYRYGSRLDHDGVVDRADLTVRRLAAAAHRLFPDLGPVPIDHAWCGALAVPRDWCASVVFDPRTGMGSAGGYSGTGVAAANLAGRTLRDLVLGERSELTALPWVGHVARRWEPEPLRWMGAHTVAALYRWADRHESGRRRTSPLARAADLVAGR